MSASDTIYTTCRGCGADFAQPDDPGRKRVFCSNACKQRDYRSRGGRASGTRKAKTESRSSGSWYEDFQAYADQQAKREKERQRNHRRRGTRDEQVPTPEWTASRAGDDSKQAKMREKCRLLYVRANHSGTGEEEAASCRRVADAMKAKYGL